MYQSLQGNLGLGKAIQYFTSQGITVALPLNDTQKYDLIADFNGKLQRIQIKYCGQQISETNSIICPCASSTNHTTNKHLSTYKNDIDYFCFYIAAWDKLLLVPISIIGNKKSICFRLDKPKNNQSNVNLVEDFTFDKILCVETLYDESKV